MSTYRASPRGALTRSPAPEGPISLARFLLGRKPPLRGPAIAGCRACSQFPHTPDRLRPPGCVRAPFGAAPRCAQEIGARLRRAFSFPRASPRTPTQPELPPPRLEIRLYG